MGLRFPVCSQRFVAGLRLEAEAAAPSPALPPASITVSISLTGSSILLGNSLAFAATVSNTTNTAVTWSINGAPGGSPLTGTPDTAVRWSLTSAACPALCGSIDLNGNYTAPQILPLATTATVTAQSVVAATNATNDAIALSSTAPAAAGKDIVFVDPTTASVSAQGHDVDLNVAALGLFLVANNSCSLAGNPIPLQRPASGSATFDLCILSESGLVS